MYKLGALLLRDANVSLSEDEQSQRLDQFVDDAYSVEYQLAQVSDRFIPTKVKLTSANKKWVPAPQQHFQWLYSN